MHWIGNCISDCGLEAVPHYDHGGLLDYRLGTFSVRYLQTLMSWFTDAGSLQTWSLYSNFPFTADQFLVEAGMDRIPSFALLSPNDEIVGFGQYSLMNGNCHLSRIVIAPEVRGQGLAKTLIEALIINGFVALGRPCCSLFVARDNVVAINLYLRLGFTKGAFPDQRALDQANYYFLTRPSLIV